MLEINGFLKFVEEDIFDTGCQPDTTRSYFVEDEFKAESQTELIKNVCDSLGIEDKRENYLFNSCDEPGRIDFQLLEDSEGTVATKQQINDWKRGKCRLWAATYSAQVQEVDRKVYTLLV